MEDASEPIIKNIKQWLMDFLAYVGTAVVSIGAFYAENGDVINKLIATCVGVLAGWHWMRSIRLKNLQIRKAQKEQQ